MKFSSAFLIVVFLTVISCSNGGGGPSPVTTYAKVSEPKNNWKNEICIELGYLLVEAEKINELRHCSATMVDIRDGINRRVTIIRQILNNHGALCSQDIKKNSNDDGNFNKNAFD